MSRILDVAGIPLDEVAARLDLVAHQHREHLVGSGGVLDGHLLEDAVRRVHGRLAQLARVHLAEALEPLEVEALLGQLEDGGAQLLEGVHDLLELAHAHRERRRADDLDEARVRRLQAAVARALEQCERAST